MIKKGVILAGGLGQRLGLFTQRVANKSLVLLYDKPALVYIIKSLTSIGITEIIIVTGARYKGQLVDFLGDGKEFGVTKLYYVIQHEPNGIAAALKLVEDFIHDEKFIMLLGDNYFGDSLKDFVKDHQYVGGARVLLKEVGDPQRFGIAEINEDTDEILSIEEKPVKPKSNYAIVGAYIFDRSVWQFINTQKQSARGELEITDTLKTYLQYDLIKYSKLEGCWFDVGTFDSLLDCANYLKNQNIK